MSKNIINHRESHIDVDGFDFEFVDGKVSTLEIARVFGKRHSDIMRRVRNKFSELTSPFSNGVTNCSRRKIASVTYSDTKGEDRSMYLLTKNEMIMIIMAFNGKKAEKFQVMFIEAFDLMAQLLRENNLPVPTDVQSLATDTAVKAIQGMGDVDVKDFFSHMDKLGEENANGDEKWIIVKPHPRGKSTGEDKNGNKKPPTPMAKYKKRIKQNLKTLAKINDAIAVGSSLFGEDDYSGELKNIENERKQIEADYITDVEIYVKEKNKKK